MNLRIVGLLALLATLPALHGCFLAAAGAVAGTAMVAEDRRSAGTMLDDQNIEMKVANAISNKYGNNDQVQVNNVSYNRYVLLVGEAPTEEIKKDIGVLALGTENVRNVQNEIVVGPPASLSQRSNDSLTTTKVKGRLVSENKVQVNYIKVVTRNDVVYLMGIVTPKEADAATEIARTTGGVQKVVRVFELQENL